MLLLTLLESMTNRNMQVNGHNSHKPVKEDPKVLVCKTNQLVIKHKSATHKLPASSITHLTCKSYITTIHLSDGTQKAVPILLKHFDEKLTQSGFFRTSREVLVNLHAVAELKKGQQAIAVLTSGESIPVSRSRYKHFRDAFEAEFDK